MHTFPVAVVFALLALQLIFSLLLTRRLLASSFYEPLQKRLQLLLLWLLPVLGVVLVWLFLIHERPTAGVAQQDEDDDVVESLFAHRDSPSGNASGSVGDARDA